MKIVTESEGGESKERDMNLGWEGETGGKQGFKNLCQRKPKWVGENNIWGLGRASLRGEKHALNFSCSLTNRYKERTCSRDRRDEPGHAYRSLAGVGLPTGAGGGGSCVGAGWARGHLGHADGGRSGAVEARGEVVVCDAGAAVLVEAAGKRGVGLVFVERGGDREREKEGGGTDLRSIRTDEQLQA